MQLGYICSMQDSSIELVVFDIAGTTIKDENNVHLSLINALAAFGYTITLEEANAVMGYPKPYAIEHLLLKKEDNLSKVTPELIRQIHDYFVLDMINFYANSSNVKPTLYAEETLILLKKLGIKVALDTGFSKDITETILKNLKWYEKGFIDAHISSDEVEAGRPYPYMIQTLMSRLNIDSSEKVAKVGDTVSDLQEGNNAACKYVIGLTSGAFKKSELQEHPHTHLIDNLLEIIQIVTVNDASK